MHCNHIRRLTPLTFDIDFMFVNVNYRLYVAFEIYSRWHTGIDKVPINEKWAFPCTCWLVVVQGWSIMGWQKLQKKNVKPARDEGKTVHQFPKNVIRYYIIGKNVTVCNCNCKFDYCTLNFEHVLEVPEVLLKLMAFSKPALCILSQRIYLDYILRRLKQFWVLHVYSLCISNLVGAL